MAISLVQHVISSQLTVTSGGSGTLTIASTGAGNFLVVAVSRQLNLTTADVKIGTSPLTNAVTIAASDVATEIWYLANITGGQTTITVDANTGTSNLTYILAAEYSGLGASATVDQIATGTGFGGTVTTGATPTTRAANELLFGAFASDGAASTAGSGYTLLDNAKLGGLGALSEYEIVSSTGAYTATTGGATGQEWALALATFGALTTTPTYRPAPIPPTGLYTPLTPPAMVFQVRAPWIRDPHPAVGLGAGLTPSGSIGGRSVTRLWTATLSFAGTIVRAATHLLPAGSLSFASGTIQKQAARLLPAGTLSVAGAIGRQANRSYVATLTSTGRIAKAITRPGLLPIAGLNLAGSFIHAPNRFLTAALSFAGSVGRVISGRTFTGSLRATSSWVAAKTTNTHVFLAIFDALLSPGGQENAASTRALPAAALAFAGAVYKQAQRLFAPASLSSGVTPGSQAQTLPFTLPGTLGQTFATTGVVDTAPARVFQGILTTIGTESAATARLLLAAASFAGSTAKAATRTLPAAVLSGSGTLVKQAQRTALATLAIAATVTRQAQKPFQGSLAASGSEASQTLRVLAATLLTIGAAPSRAIDRGLSAAASFIGGVAKQYTPVSYQATLASAGTFGRVIAKPFVAVASFAGTIPGRSITRGLAATAAFVGASPARALTRALVTAALTSGGALIHGPGRLFTGTLSFIGSQAKATTRDLVPATLLSTGSVLRQTARTLVTATLSSAGAVVRLVGRPLVTATLAASGLIVRGTTAVFASGLLLFGGSSFHQATKSFTAALTATAAVSRLTVRSFSAVWSGSGTFGHTIGRVLTAGLTFAGSRATALARALTPASLSPSGLLNRASARAFVVATLSPSGLIAKAMAVPGRLTAASLGFAGSYGRQINKPFAGSLQFSGGIGRAIGRAFGAALSFATSLVGGARNTPVKLSVTANATTIVTVSAVQTTTVTVTATY